ncbi:MAG: hypothetical protein HGB12_07020 [Bacteroidetes bacterium]|nr:hypothetical protein [Bacteroidota bacterium]
MNLQFDYLKRLKIFLAAKKGFIFTLFLSIFILLIFYGNLLKSINSVYFGKDGDGLQSYYTTIYHVKYDSTYSHFQGMNYPYGEHILFTNCQPVISNTLKFISQNIIDVSDYTVGVINLMMLFSIVIAALFLYLIFKEFKLNWIYSAFVATGIAYLSPLLNRFPGHYSLSYVFTIPVLIYLLIKFYKNPSWKKSLITGIFVFLMATFHMYNFAFAAFIFGIFWTIQLITDKKYRKLKFAILNIFLQIILPLLVINIWLWLTDTVNDRTSSPWGFLVFKSSWEGIFLQHQDVTLPFLKSFMHPQSVEWEGWAYVGHLAAYFYIFIFTVWACIPFITTGKMGFFLTILLTGIIIQLFKRKKWNLFTVVDNKLLSILLWTGFLSLLFSFAWPFSFYPKLLNYVGYMRQFRGIGRFSWIFYYTINIGVFYFIYNFKFLRKYAHIGVLILCIFILNKDAYDNSLPLQNILNNSNPEFTNKSVNSDIDDIIKPIDAGKYQSIISIPYFHVGSENYGIGPKCNSPLNSFIVSLKTGLPLNDVMMSRTSISQTYSNISVINEPYKPLEILKKCNSEKPFLLLVTECSEITLAEKTLILKAALVSKGERFSLYELKKETLLNITDSLYLNATREKNQERLYLKNNFYASDSVARFVNIGFEENKNNFAYNSKGCYTGKITDFNTIFEGTIPNAIPDSNYIFSFWFGKIHHDVYALTTIEIAFYDSLGNVYNTDYKGVQSIFKIIDNDWALAEFEFRLKNRNDKLKVTLWNNDLTNKDTLFVDEILIRPLGDDLFKEINKKTIMKNNRFYIKNI